MLYKLKGEGLSAIFVPLKPTTMAAQGFLEKTMEQWLAANPEAVVPSEERLLVIDQEKAFENLTDILAVDADGNVVVIEVKRGQTPRDVIAQALEYASDVESWDYSQLNLRATAYFASRGLTYESLLSGFQDYFSIEAGGFDESQFNRRQRIFIVGETIEPKIERTARWLLRRGIEIGCLSYLCYRSDDGDLLLNFEEVVRREEAIAPKDGQDPNRPRTDWDEETFERALVVRNEKNPATVAAGRRILEWVKTSTGLRPGWGKGKHGPLYPTVEHAGQEFALLGVLANGRIELNFASLQSVPGFAAEEKRLQLLTRLNQIRGVNLVPARSGSWTSFSLALLADDAEMQRFLDTLEWFVQQVRAS